MKNTNERFIQDINRIVRVEHSNEASLPEIQPEPISSGRGIGVKNEPKSSGSIASPLNELGHLREYYEPELLTSSDGLFVMEIQPLKKLVFIDNDGNEVVTGLADDRLR